MLFRADRQTDGQTDMKLVVALRKFANAPKSKILSKTDSSTKQSLFLKVYSVRSYEENTRFTRRTIVTHYEPNWPKLQYTDLNNCHKTLLNFELSQLGGKS